MTATSAKMHSNSDFPALKDGTNLPFGTEYFVAARRRLPWYLPHESTPTYQWKEKLIRIQSQFQEIVNKCRPRRVTLHQSRIPGRQDSEDAVDNPHQNGFHSSGPGIDREFGQLCDKQGHPLFSDFPMGNVNGNPMSNSAGDAFAFQYGLSRYHTTYIRSASMHESRPEAGPELRELAIEACGVMYGLPGTVSKVIWKNWPQGFHKEISEWFWVDALFEMAWQRPNGTSLQADRYAVIRQASFQLQGAGLFPRLPVVFLKNLVGDGIDHEYGNPESYYSTIDDLARASVSLIDAILNIEETQNRELSTKKESVMESQKSVFISYSHKDKKFLGELLEHLKPHVRVGAFTAWADNQLTPGSHCYSEIEKAIANASVAVLLVSPAFLASDFIHDNELGPLLKKAKEGGVRILWALLRDCAWESTRLENLQAVYPIKQKIAGMKLDRRDQAWKEICMEIKKALET